MGYSCLFCREAISLDDEHKAMKLYRPNTGYTEAPIDMAHEECYDKFMSLNIGQQVLSYQADKTGRYEKLILRYNPKSLIGLGKTIYKWEQAARNLEQVRTIEDVLNIAGSLQTVCGLCKSDRTPYEEELTEHLLREFASMCSGCPYLYTFEEKCYKEQWYRDLNLPLAEMSRERLSAIIQVVKLKLDALRKKFEEI